MRSCSSLGLSTLAALVVLMVTATVADIGGSAEVSPSNQVYASEPATGLTDNGTIRAAGAAGRSCNPGLGRYRRSWLCSPCRKAAWNDGKSSVCKPCPQGTTTENEGARSADECICPAGFNKRSSSSGNSGYSCWPICNSHMYLDVISNTCKACGQGMQSNSGSIGKESCKSVLQACPLGTGISRPLSTLCRPCKLGYYNPGDLSYCNRCPNGLTTLTPGAADCGCPPGTGANPPSQACKPCPPGTYSTGGSMGPCTPCPGPYMTSPPQAVSVRFCMCKAGFGVVPKYPDVCVICPKGTYSSGTDARAAQATAKPSLAPCTPCCDKSMPASSCNLTTKAPGAKKYEHCVKRPSPPREDLNSTLAPDFLPSIVLRPNASAIKELKLGCILPLGNGSTPEDVSVAQAVMVGLQMAINDTLHSALPGMFVNLTVCNTKCEGIPAAECVKHLAAEGVAAIFGDVCSSSSLAAVAADKPVHIPIISPAATSPSLSMRDLFFRTVPSDVFQGSAASHLMFEDFGARYIGQVYESNTYGYGLVTNMQPEDGNKSVVASYAFMPGQGNPEEAVRVMKQVRDDPATPIGAVYLAMNDVGFAAKFILESKKQDLKLPLYGSDTFTTTTLLDALRGQDSDIDQLTVISINPGRAQFVHKFNDAAPGIRFEPYAAPAYDAMIAFINGYKTAGALKSPADVALAIRNQVFEGVTGPVQFNILGDIVPHADSYVYGQFNQETGQFELTGFLNSIST